MQSKDESHANLTGQSSPLSSAKVSTPIHLAYTPHRNSHPESLISEEAQMLFVQVAQNFLHEIDQVLAAESAQRGNGASHIENASGAIPGITNSTFNCLVALAKNSTGEHQASLFSQLARHALADTENISLLLQVGLASHDSGFEHEGRSLLQQAIQRIEKLDAPSFELAAKCCSEILTRRIEPIMAEIPDIMQHQLTLLYKSAWTRIDEALSEMSITPNGLSSIKALKSECATSPDIDAKLRTLVADLEAKNECVKREGLHGLTPWAIDFIMAEFTFKSAPSWADQVASLAGELAPLSAVLSNSLVEIARNLNERGWRNARLAFFEELSRISEHLSEQVELEHAVSLLCKYGLWPRSKSEQDEIVADIQARIDQGCRVRDDDDLTLYEVSRKAERHPYNALGERPDLLEPLAEAISPSLSHPTLICDALPKLHSLDMTLDHMDLYICAARNLPPDLCTEERQQFLSSWQQNVEKVSGQVEQDLFCEYSKALRFNHAICSRLIKSVENLPAPSPSGSHFVCLHNTERALMLMRGNTPRTRAEGLRILLDLPEDSRDLANYVSRYQTTALGSKFENSEIFQSDLKAFNQCQFKAEQLLRAAEMLPATESAARNWLIGEAIERFRRLSIDPQNTPIGIIELRLRGLYQLRSSLERLDRSEEGDVYPMLTQIGEVISRFQEAQSSTQPTDVPLKRWAHDLKTRIECKRAMWTAKNGDTDTARSIINDVLTSYDGESHAGDDFPFNSLKESLTCLADNPQFQAEASRLASILIENFSPVDSTRSKQVKESSSLIQAIQNLQIAPEVRDVLLEKLVLQVGLPVDFCDVRDFEHLGHSVVPSLLELAGDATLPRASCAALELVASIVASSTDHSTNDQDRLAVLSKVFESACGIYPQLKERVSTLGRDRKRAEP